MTRHYKTTFDMFPFYINKNEKKTLLSNKIKTGLRYKYFDVLITGIIFMDDYTLYSNQKRVHIYLYLK